MKKYLVYFLAAIATVLVGVIVYVLAPYPAAMRIDALRPSPSVQLAAGARRCAPSTLYYSESNGYTDAGEGVVDSYCSKWQFELQRAIQASDLESARKALAMGANPNSPGDDYSLTYALPLAASIGNIEMVRLLLDNGADIDFQECCCMSCYAPLTHAVDTDNVELVRLLVARGANVNYAIAYEDGMTLRTHAEQKGNKKVLEILDEAAVALSWRLRAKKRLTKLVHLGA
jgi:hypothetical protein